MIDWASVERTLRRQLRQPTVKVGEGRLHATNMSRPLLGHELLLAASDSHEERAEISTYDLWPGTVLEFLEKRWRPHKWFDFYWDSIGPTSWISGLYLLRLGDRRSVVS